MRSVARLLPGAYVRLCTSVYRLMPGKTSPEPTHSPTARGQAFLLFHPQPSGLRWARWPRSDRSRGESCRGGGSAGPQGSPGPAASPLCPLPSPQLLPPLRKPDRLGAAELQPARLGRRARGVGVERGADEGGRRGPQGTVGASTGSRPPALGRGQGNEHAPPLAPPRPPRGAGPAAAGPIRAWERSRLRRRIERD